MTNNNNNQLISVVITTYNWPAALKLVLMSYAVQTDTNFELIIADDGSDTKTKAIIDTFKQKSPISIKHVWHEDKGFRASKIRNLAVLQAEGDYLVFSDGDCLALPNFIQCHRFYKRINFFVAGNRILLNKRYTEKIIKDEVLITEKSVFSVFVQRFKGNINRLLPFLPLNINFLLQNEKWQGAKTCNLAVWRKDFLEVNGFDERFEGWGYEDSDLVIRLLKLGCRRQSVKFGLPVLHLWHPENNRSQAAQNLATLHATEKQHSYKAVLGLENAG